MAKRNKRTSRRRSSRNPLHWYKNRRFLLLLVLFTILLGSFLILQSSQIRSVLGIALANSTPLVNSTTPTRTINPATPSLRPPPSNSTPVRVDQSWKDYSSPAFGYALKYPPSMIYREWTPAQDILHSVSFYLEKDSNLPLSQLPEVTVSIFANPQSQDTKQWFTAHLKPIDGSAVLFADVLEQQTITVDGIQALSFEEKPSGPASAHRVLLARNNQIFSILVTDFGDASLREIYWAMVSTLRWSAPRP